MSFKKLIVLTCFLVLSLIGLNGNMVHASKNADAIIANTVVNSEKYVSNDGDLILRDAANSKGKKVTMLKKGSKVFVYSTDKNGWSYVKQGKLKGYTLDKHLTTKKVNNSTSTQNSTVNYNLKIQELDNAIYEFQVKQMKYPKHSQEYRNLLEKELILQKEKLNLMEQKKKALEKIINGK